MLQKQGLQKLYIQALHINSQSDKYCKNIKQQYLRQIIKRQIKIKRQIIKIL